MKLLNLQGRNQPNINKQLLLLMMNLHLMLPVMMVRSHKKVVQYYFLLDYTFFSYHTAESQIKRQLPFLGAPDHNSTLYCWQYARIIVFVFTKSTRARGCSLAISFSLLGSDWVKLNIGWDNELEPTSTLVKSFNSL